MKQIISAALLLISAAALGQNTFRARIVDDESGEPLIGATISLGSAMGAVSDLNGIVEITDIQSDTIKVSVSFVGYQAHDSIIVFPMPAELMVLRLIHAEELEEIIVTTTRSSRTIDAIPTRVEVIGSEELEEKAVMRSANIAMVLRESTGIQMQQTSASSANQSIRIQGLDGRYTQLLKDGFPLFGGFSGGLSIMQIPPLDLKQVEVIKGSNSTLFGGGAIAGLVNLVTITPEEDRKLRLMIDQTQAKGTTLNGFYAKKFDRFGLTFFGSVNRQEAYDPNDDDFSDIPRIRSLTINPSFFYDLSNDSNLRLTLNSTFENRIGGDMTVINDSQAGIHQFTEENKSDRLSYQLTYHNNLGENRSLDVKNSLTYFNRDVEEPGFNFRGDQWSSFNEVAYNFGTPKSGWITGVNLYSEKFNEQPTDTLIRDYSYVTLGAFGQNTTELSSSLGLESGLRLDYDLDYGLFALPRLSLLAKLNQSWTARVGGGLGYKLPTIFTEEAESQTFQGILPIDNEMNAERSVGGNVDINYKTPIGDHWTFSINQLFFLTQLNDALVFRQNGQGQFFYDNANGPVRSQGMETNLKVTYKDFKLFANYAFISTRLMYDNLDQQKPLTPKHSIGAVLVYEVHGKWRIGYESYFTGSQFREDRSKTSDYWYMGLMALRKFKQLSVYINFENFTDTRQHKLENFNVGSHFKPEFPQIWAPIDGSIINAGLIFEL